MTKNGELGMGFWLIFFAAIGASICSIVGQCGAAWWIGDMFSHFLVQYTLIQGVAVGYCIFKKRWGLGLFIAYFFVMNALCIIPLYFRPDFSLLRKNSSQEPSCTLLFANVHACNRNYSRLMHYIKLKRPDVIILAEINPRWMDALSGLHKEYPYVHAVFSSSKRMGICVFSQSSFLTLREIAYARTPSVPSILFQLDIKGKTVTFLGMHARSPLNKRRFDTRNYQLAMISVLRQQYPTPFVVAGDLNISCWSTYYRRYIDAEGFLNCRQGFGIIPTWPSVAFFMLIPIDHVLYTTDLFVQKVIRGPFIGSDHYPLYVIFGGKK